MAGMMCTHSGKILDPANMTARDVRLDDIVWHLSNICRFGGACSRFYSVLEHTMFVVKMAKQHGMFDGVWGCERSLLLVYIHDFHEAYGTGDVVSVVKDEIPGIPAMQAQMDAVIYEHFGVKPPTDAEAKFVKLVDTWALIGEATMLLPHNAVRAICDRTGIQLGNILDSWDPEGYIDEEHCRESFLKGFLPALNGYRNERKEVEY